MDFLLVAVIAKKLAYWHDVCNRKACKREDNDKDFKFVEVLEYFSCSISSSYMLSARYSHSILLLVTFGQQFAIVKAYKRLEGNALPKPKKTRPMKNVIKEAMAIFLSR